MKTVVSQTPTGVSQQYGYHEGTEARTPYTYRIGEIEKPSRTRRTLPFFDGCRQNVLFQAGKLVRVLATGHSAQRACKQKERPPTTVEMSSEHKVLIELTDFIPVLYRNQAPRVFHRNGTTDSGSLGTRGNEWYVDTAKVMPEVATDA